MTAEPRLRGLYAITDATLSPGEKLLADAEHALRGGAGILQYREKSTDATKREREARALLALCEAYDALLIINDDYTLAAAIGAHGVHIGRDDAALSEVRRLLGPERIIGVSCYNSLEMARDAARHGADYVAFGSVFASPTKPRAPRAELALFREARQTLEIPVCAIGGITLDNAAEVIDAGADMLAIISGIFAAPDPEAAARAFRALF